MAGLTGLRCGLVWLRSADFLKVPHLAAFLTLVTWSLAVCFARNMRASTPAALDCPDLGVVVGAAAVEESLAAQPGLFSLHKDQQLLQGHRVGVGVR